MDFQHLQWWKLLDHCCTVSFHPLRLLLLLLCTEYPCIQFTAVVTVSKFIQARAPDKAIHYDNSCLTAFCLVLDKAKHAMDFFFLIFFLFELPVTVSAQDQLL